MRCHGNRRQTQRWMWVLSSLVLSGMAFGQSVSREELTEPVLRVADDSAAAPHTETTRPVLDASLKAEARSAGAASEPKVASLATMATPRPTVPVPSKSEAQRLLDEAVADAARALDHIRREVRDYTCILIKRERVNGEVLPMEYIAAKIRNRREVDGKVDVPFSVYMKFLKPTDMRGREVLYVEGENGNKMRAKEGGTRGRFLPSLWLAPTGRFAMQGNRYPITEVGVENLAARLIERARADTSIEKCKVTYRSDAKIEGRPCRYLEVRRPVPKTGDELKHGMNVFVAQVFIDEEFNVPVRYAAYDWPARPNGRPEVVEEYTYQDLKINVGLTDRDFDIRNPSYGF